MRNGGMLCFDCGVRERDAPDGRCEECYWTNMEVERMADEMELEQIAEKASDEYWEEILEEEYGIQ